jgi:hypothetical protein
LMASSYSLGSPGLSRFCRIFQLYCRSGTWSIGCSFCGRLISPDWRQHGPCLHIGALCVRCSPARPLCNHLFMRNFVGLRGSDRPTCTTS